MQERLDNLFKKMLSPLKMIEDEVGSNSKPVYRRVSNVPSFYAKQDNKPRNLACFIDTKLRHTMPDCSFTFEARNVDDIMMSRTNGSWIAVVHTS